MGEALFVAGAVPFALLGVTHFAQTLRDVRTPTSFVPTDPTLIPVLEATGVKALASGPGAQSMWRVWLGANLTHALGVLVFAVLLGTIALYDADLVAEIAVLRPLAIGIALTYVVIAARFWFLPAAIASGAGLACFVASTLV